jgi:glycosyltransferase involved in cell wall biosynthesis
MPVLKSTRLVLFFTHGMSLRTWDRIGMFEREVALYRELKKRLERVSFITYGNSDDLSYAERIPGIEILCNSWNLPLRIYSKLIPLLHRVTLRKADIYKTNQTNGAGVALKAAQWYHKPVIARCGYMWSDFVSRGAEKGYPLEKVVQAEKKVFTSAEKVVVTTVEMKEKVEKNYSIRSEKIQVIPNYVCTDILVPRPQMRDERLVCFVGRLEPQKNSLALIEAIEGLNVRLLVIGQGGLRREMEMNVREKGIDVRFEESVRHELLGDYLNQAALFVLPSHYEGHPKTLIEAMSCGLPVIGADSPGIREVIRHRETGYLCGTDPSSIRTAIQALLSDKSLREYLGRNARQYVLENFALDKIVEMELTVLKEVVTAYKKYER